MQSIDRRRFIQKAGLATAVTGAVWATPSIIGSSAAFAAGSVCGPRTLDWNAFTVGSTFSSALVDDVTVSVATNTFKWGTGGNTSPTVGANLTIQASPHGGITGKSLRIDQKAVSAAGQEITFSFSKPVKNITFTITDIDTQSSSWSDRVAIVTTPFTWNSRGTNLYGSGENVESFNNNNSTGQLAGPFRPIDTINLDDNSAEGNAGVTVSGPVTSFVVKFWCGPVQSSNQRINFSNITFNTCP